MFGARRAQDHAGEIPLRPTFSELSGDAFEIARFWVSADRSFVAVGRPDDWQPELLGSLLVESIQTAAAAYSAQTDLTEAEALARIWAGIDEERARLGK